MVESGYAQNFVLWSFLTLALVTGALLGAFFFGGLWWTVQKIAAGDSPHLLFVASFAVRTAVVMLGFYFLLNVSWPHLAASLVGFLIARAVLARRLKPVPRT
ncbi:MAG: ATP synthase subunit I [Thermaerobacterales bacterium]